jgi:4-amino-4-deoxy-L-arabinose transferase-like glycosyltransferase
LLLPDAFEGAADTRRWVLSLIVAGAAVRLALGASLGLSVDESYAVVMARELGLSYFDHPPMTFWWAGLAGRLVGSEGALWVRLPFIAAFAGTTWVMFRLGQFLFGERAGLWAAVILNLSLFFSFAAGGFALPDGPLLLFDATAAYALARATLTAWGGSPRGAVPGPGQARAWMAFGAFTGLALLSKYHGVFLLLGGVVFLLSSRLRRGWLRRPEPYVATVIAAAVFTPVLVWNQQHDWASFRFQLGRAIPLESARATPFLDNLAGQAGWILPWIWLPLLVVLFAGLRSGPRDERRWLLVCLGAGPILGFTLLTVLGERGNPHWQAPGYFMLLPILGADVARRLSDHRRARTRMWLATCAVGFALVVVGLVAHVRNGWAQRVAPGLLTHVDPTDDFLDWAPVAEQLRAWGLPKPATLIGGARWEDAAKLAYTLGPETLVSCVGEDSRGFAYVSDPAAHLGKDIVLVVRRRPGGEALRLYAPYFRRLLFVGNVPIPHGPRPGIVVNVYVGEGLLRPLPLLRSLGQGAD